MVRSVGIAAVIVGLAWTGLVLAQPSNQVQPGASPPRERFLTVREEGKPPQRCKLLKTWREPNGTSVFQVQAVDSGELMTIVGSAPASGGQQGAQAMTTRIFRWGPDNKPPAGAPVPPPSASPPAPQVRAPAPPAQPAPNRVLPWPPSAVAPPTPAPVASRPIPPISPAPAPRVTATPTALPKPKPGAEQAPLAKMTAPILPPPPNPTTPVAQPGKPSSPIAPPQPSRDAKSTPVAATPTAKPVIVQGPISKPEVGNGPPIIPVKPRLIPLPGGTVTGRNTCNACCQPSCNTCCQPSCKTCCQPSCNTCCQSSCVCSTPSPLRQSWLGRLFKPNPPCDAVACKPATTPPTTAAKPTPPATAVAKAATEPPQPRDWRESWGKIEPWKGAPPADTAKRADTPTSKPVDAPTRPVAHKPVALDPPKQPDPLKDPNWYGEMALKQKPTNSKIPEETPKQKLFSSKTPEKTVKPVPPPEPKKVAVVQSPPRPLPPLPAPQSPATPAPAPAAQPVPPAPPAPPAEMVAISPTQPRSQVVQVPADEPNAFAPEAPPAGAEQQPKFNAFARDDGSPPPRGGFPAMARAPQGPMPMGGPAMGPIARSGPAMGPMPMPMPPRPPMPPPMVDSGVPSGMSNAFTLTSTRRPIPANFGGTPQEPNGFGDAAPHMEGPGSPPQGYVLPRSGMMPPPYPGMQGTPGYPRPAAAVNPLMSVPPVPLASSKPVAPTAPTGSAPQLLSTLKESPYPSQREWAAEQLSELNWRMQPQVVESLTKGALNDPAGTVRAACVRALGHMKVNTQEVVALVQELKNDRDTRVRQEAGETLNAIGIVPRQDTDVRQASHK